MMDKEEYFYYLAFNQAFEVVGPQHFNQLLKVFGSAKRAWEKVNRGILLKMGWGEKGVDYFLEIRKDLDLKSKIDALGKLNIKLLRIKDKDYPQNLKKIHNPPYLLYLRGNLPLKDQMAIAVVGSRRATSYGREVTESLVSDLVSQGLTIVSGLAFGIDAAAHTAALKMGGRTVAILASGVDNITPPSNLKLAEAIIKSNQGAILSEYPLGTSPQPYFFPVRNRIISGLSLGVVVVEAAEKSGALITANLALEQGREVFAVPGPIYNSLSVGTHNLIKSGAKLVQSVDDILEELQLEARAKIQEARKIIPETPEEKTVLKILGEDTLHIDEIARKSNFSSSSISSLLTLMEMKGMVKNIGNQVYRVAR